MRRSWRDLKPWKREDETAEKWENQKGSEVADTRFEEMGSLCISPVLKSSTVEFDNYQKIFVQHFASQPILTKGVLAKYRYFLWNWTHSHIQRIYKGHNSENPLRAITFDWSVLRNWGQRLWATFLMLFSGIPHLPTFCHVACVTYVMSRLSRASRMSRTYTVHTLYVHWTYTVRTLYNSGKLIIEHLPNQIPHQIHPSWNMFHVNWDDKSKYTFVNSSLSAFVWSHNEGAFN